MENRLEALGGGICAVVSPLHSFGTDALLLGYFAKPGKRDIVCDLGSGCGILPLLWCRDGLCQQIYAVELQKAACLQAENAIERNGLESKLQVLCADLRSLAGILPFGKFDLVTMNPPYAAKGSGLVSKSEAAALARHEQTCSFSDACESAAKLLRFGGRLCMCCRPERLFALMQAMHAAGMEPKRLRLVSKTAQSAPWLALLEARRGGKPGLLAQAGLFLYTAQGEMTQEARLFYGAYHVSSVINAEEIHKG